MTILYEINPPKVSSASLDPESMMHDLAQRASDVLDVCDGVLVTDSVLGRERHDPIQMASIIKEYHPKLEIISSMRTVDRTSSKALEFASRAHDAKLDGILVVKGDPKDGIDSGLIPSQAAKIIQDKIKTYLSVPSNPDFTKIAKKLDAHPVGFFTQVVDTTDKVKRICNKLLPDDFRVIPCILVASEKNSGSAEFLGIDFSLYNDDMSGFVKSVHEIAGDVLLTSPSDMRATLGCINTRL